MWPAVDVPYGSIVVPHGVIVWVALMLWLVSGAARMACSGLVLTRGLRGARQVIALLLWQGVGLAGGFSMIGALALTGLRDPRPEHPWLALIPALAFALYLLAHLAVTIVQVTQQRHRHLALLDLLTAPHPTRARTRVIDEVPVASCTTPWPAS